jgi:hypothetical protein
MRGREPIFQARSKRSTASLIHDPSSVGISATNTSRGAVEALLPTNRRPAFLAGVCMPGIEPRPARLITSNVRRPTNSVSNLLKISPNWLAPFARLTDRIRARRYSADLDRRAIYWVGNPLQLTREDLQAMTMPVPMSATRPCLVLPAFCL